MIPMQAQNISIFLSILLIVFLCSCNGTQDNNRINSVSNLHSVDTVKVIRGAIVLENKKTYHRDVLLDSLYISSIPKFDQWEFEYLGKETTSVGETVHCFNIYFNGDILYDHDNIRRYFTIMITLEGIYCTLELL